MPPVNIIDVNIDEKSRFIDVSVRGASMGIGHNMGDEYDYGGGLVDTVKISILKENCDLSKLEAEEISCDVDKKLGATDWLLNPVVSKQYRGFLNSISLRTNKTTASLEFTLKSDENIQPSVENQKYSVDRLDPSNF